jgi:hypothetical protein
MRTKLAFVLAVIIVGPLDEAKARGWTVVDMKNDWKRVLAFEQ